MSCTTADDETESINKDNNNNVEKQFIKNLENIIEGVTMPICTGGTVKFKKDDNAIKIHHKPSNENFTIKPARMPPGPPSNERMKIRLDNQIKNLLTLTGKIPEAPFGHGRDTVYDKSVRDALQLKAEDFTINIPQELLDEIIIKVKNDLHLQTDITVELYSLNVYRKGGKFIKHKDTPRGDGMFGTLVICLPSLFTGGQFKLSMGKLNFTYFEAGYPHNKDNEGGDSDWWGYDSDNNETTLPWCAFYADVDHEIKPVIDGVRITVAYLIRRKDNETANNTTTTPPIILPRPIGADEQSTIFQQELGRALRNEDFLSYGGKIGSPCFHMYTNKEVFPGTKGSSDALSVKQIKNLKGVDLMIASVASKSFGLDIYLVPYLSHDCQGDMGDLRLDKFPKNKKCPKYMSENDVGSFFRGYRPNAMNDYDDDPPENDADLWIFPFGNYEQASDYVGYTDNYETHGCYGNEGVYTTFYVKSALFIEVPSYTDSRGQKNEENQQQPPAKKQKASKADNDNKNFAA